MKYDYHESFKHKTAKELLHSWLKEIHDDNTIDYSIEHPFGKALPFYWRKNYGVFIELPFYTSSDPYYFECSGGLSCKHDPVLYDHPSQVPECDCEFDENGFLKSFNRGHFLFVPDITIFHKGEAKIFIEVVHTNPTSKDKLNKILKFFSGHWIEVYEISADSILNCTNKHKKLDFKTIIYDSEIL